MYAIEAPESLGPSRGGLLQVLKAVDDGDVEIFYHGVQYQGMLCGHSKPVPDEGTDKVFDQLPLIEGEAFRIYRGVDVSLFQHKIAEDMAVAAFKAGESWAVERAVQETLLNPSATDITPTPGTPVTAKVALGMAEQYAADQYSGLPMLHTNRFGAVLLPDTEVNTENWTLNTKQGTPIANGGGYGAVGPGGAVAPDGSAWLYVSGQVTVWRQEAVVIPDGYFLKGNRKLALVEGQYASTVDCFVAAILVGT